MATFPSLMALSLPIFVNGDARTPYQWAAAMAPGDKLVAYKDAMLWLEGETFGSEEEFRAKVERIVTYQSDENHVPTSAVAVPVEPVASGDGSDGWARVPALSAPKKKAATARWTSHQLARAIVDACIVKMGHSFKFAGPSLSIKDVYSQFKTAEFTYPQLIGAVRDEIGNLPAPSMKFAVPKSARYNAASSPGKGKNFNFKVQGKDKNAPNGWSALAQIHVIWE